MSDIELIQGDRDQTQHAKIPAVIILDRLRSTHNVGNILRLADAINAEKVICAGYTACPPHPKLAKSAMGAEDIVATGHVDEASQAALEYKARGYEIIGVETVAQAEDIWDIKFDGPVVLIFGNEALGIQAETLKTCDRFVKLPAFGLKNSINVSNSAAVVLYRVAEHFHRN